MSNWQFFLIISIIIRCLVVPCYASHLDYSLSAVVSKSDSVMQRDKDAWKIKIFDKQREVVEVDSADFDIFLKVNEIGHLDYFLIHAQGSEFELLRRINLKEVTVTVIDIASCGDDAQIHEYLKSHQYRFIRKNKDAILRFVKEQEYFGGWSISQELFDYIRNNLESGKTILELGSGWGSGQLSEHYCVYSVEHDEDWMNLYNTHYLYAPIKDGWYDVELLKEQLPETYDLIIVDGPPGIIGRAGFFMYLDLFKTDIPIIIDDINRQPEYELMLNLSEKLQRSYEIHESNKKQFGVLIL